MPSDTTPSTRGAVAAGKLPSLWRNRDFVLLWSGQAVSTLGSRMSALALPLLVLALTRSPAQAGLVAAARLVPYLLFSLPAGALVDRWNRKAVMIRCDAVRWLALGSVPLAFAFGRLSVAQLYLVALVEGTALVLFSLAEISALPRVVPEGKLPQAWSLNETAESGGQLVGPGLAGLIMGLARTTSGGAALAYLADSLSYLVSVISLRFIRVPFQAERETQAERRSLRADIAEGLIFLWRQRRLRSLAILTMAVNFLQAPLTLAIIVLARGTLHIDVRTLGLIFSAGGVGGLLGAVIAPSVQRRLRFGVIVIAGVAVRALGVAALAVANGAPLLMLGWAVVEVMWPLYAVVVVSYRLSLAPDALQGRVNSAFRLLTFGAEPLGTALGGALLVPLGARTLFWLLAAGLAVCALAVSATELRKV